MMRNIRDNNICGNDKPKLLVVNEEIPLNYESYLQRIQQRNIRLRQLQRKDKQQIEKEKREEGFSLYFQGAHKQQSATALAPRQSARTRPAGNFSSGDRRLDSGNSRQRDEGAIRSKTAPDKRVTRKGWGAGEAVSIRTEVGGFISARPPDAYSDDFEDDDTIDDPPQPCDKQTSASVQVILNKEDIHKLRQSLSNSLHFSHIHEEISPTETPEQTQYLTEITEDILQENDDLVNGHFVLEFESTSQPLEKSARNKLDYILTKIQSLSDHQHGKLLQILAELDDKTVVQDQPHDLSNAFTLHLISNWGHPTKIGLTEVDFIDEKGSKVPVENVTSRKNGKLSIRDDQSPNVLVNGKTKTSNERSMWSCDFQPGDSIEINFDFGKIHASIIQRVEIWNYNKSIKDLNIGVRHLRLTRGADQECVYEGELEKGGGNQAFARCTVVDLAEVKQKPDVKKMSLRFAEDERKECDGEDEITSAADMFRKQRQFADTKEHPASLQRQESIDDSISNTSKNDEDSSDREDEGTDVGHLSLLEQLRVLNNQQNDSFKDQDEIDHPTWYEELKNTPRKYKRPIRDEVNEIFGRESPMQKIQSERAKRSSQLPKAAPPREHFKNNSAKQLEESWSSLNFFNRSHAGRISMELHGDALDSCLMRLKAKELKVKEDEASPILTRNEVSPCRISKTKVADHFPIPEESDSGWSDEEFFIPELPYGHHLTINILSTWGDKYYVGLTGIEIFDDNGNQIRISEISANPSDINILPGYGSDPRVVHNLIDGVNKTKDDVHMWLTPFTPGQSHFVHLTFQQPRAVAMIRLWNYNKSRVHYTRGARYIEMNLDEKYIFKGEIARAIDVEEAGETILFTTDDDILEKIAQNDTLYVENIQFEEELMNTVRRNLEERPPTADGADSGKADPSSPSSSFVDTESRPFTCARNNSGSSHTRSSCYPVFNDGLVTCRVLQMNFIETWSDPHYIGLTGIAMLDAQGNCIDISTGNCTVEAEPKDVTILPGFEKDCRVIQNLIDGHNVTTDDEHMWLAPYSPEGDHIVKITFSSRTPQVLSGIRIWNYNKSPEDTYRGVKYVLISADDQPVMNQETPMNHGGAYLVRRGVGHCHFDFGQNIFFQQPPLPKIDTQNNRTSRLPQGFIYQLNLFSSWGDSYYIGLNGVELYDELGQKIPIQAHQVAACPDSVNVLSSHQSLSLDTWTQDVRTPDKLIDGENDTQDPHHMWLAPVLPGCINRVYFIFDRPITISMVKLWNYSKTPGRGVKDFALLVDDLLIHSSCLPIYSVQGKSTIGGIVPSCRPPQQHHTILFNRENVKLLSRERPFLLEDELGDGDGTRNQADGQEVRLTNDRVIVAQPIRTTVDQSLRPKTSVQSNRKLASHLRR